MTGILHPMIKASGALLFTAALATVPACSSSSSSSTDTPTGGGPGTGIGTLPIPGPDVDPPANLKLNPDVVVIHGGLSVLHRVSEDHGVWTLDKNAPGVASLVPGKIALLAGLDIARVTAVTDKGAEVDLAVAPVGFGEVVADGKLSWTNPPSDASKGILVRAPDALADPGTATQSLKPVLRLTPLDTPPPAFSVTLPDGWKIELTATPGGAATDIKVKGTRSALGSGLLGSIEATVTITLHVDSVAEASGSLSMTGGTVSDMDLTTPLSGYVEVEAIARTKVAAQFPKASLVKLPLAWEQPFPCGGLPCYISLKTAFSIQPSLATTDAGIGVKGRFDFGGSSGVSFSSGVGMVGAKPTLNDPPNLLDSSKDYIIPALGNDAIVFAIQAPRIGLGLGLLGHFAEARAGVFADVVNSFGLTVGSATALVPCQSLSWTAAAHVGGELTFKVLDGIDLNLTKQATVLTKTQSWALPDIAACKPTP